jgi:hypothetical protein
MKKTKLFISEKLNIFLKISGFGIHQNKSW